MQLLTIKKGIEEMEQIKRETYLESQRLEFLPRFVGKHFMVYEGFIFNKMREDAEKYEGGFWEYYALSNGGFYMGLDQSERITMECTGNYFKGTMSADAASIGVNLYALNTFAWQLDADKFSEDYYQLRDYALQHEEVAQIMAYID